ncbi:multidrug effflux MFS transporter [Pelagibius sp. Alg239-R121]|uniref:multidrug effflux MFS transporter n=1 Tax=Pelagibius sp. Alg239-R121 TaxID=2993448 RepID=UPI0024A67DF8|nr:multidrug effflux MFS transporter [Pelagibius sp. Alg239-R121]
MTLDIRLFAFILAVLSALAPFSIDTYLPAVPAMADYFGASVHRVEWSISSYFLGFAVGQLLGGPLSDSLGRRKIALWGLALFVSASLAISFVTSVDWMIALRVVQAIGGGFSVVVVAAIVRDRFEGREAARIYTLIGLMMMVAPLIAPAVGALLLEFWSWQAIFVALAVYGVLTVAGILTLLSETRMARRGARGPIAQSIRSALSGYGRILSHRGGLAYLLTMGFAMGVLFVYLTDSAFVFIEYYGYSHTTFPIFFSANVLSLMAFNRINAWLLKRHDPDVILRHGLILLVAVTLALLVSALASGSEFLVFPLLLVALGSLSFIGTNGTACYMTYFGEEAGAANAIMGTGRFVFGGLLGGLVGLIHDGSLLPMTGMIAFCAVMALVSYKLLRVEADNGEKQAEAEEAAV